MGRGAASAVLEVDRDVGGVVLDLLRGPVGQPGEPMLMLMLLRIVRFCRSTKLVETWPDRAGP